MTDQPEVSAGVRPGDVLAGKYRVDRVLGVGGMGVVVAAHHLQLDERVALKFLLPDAVNIPDAVARFEREARAAVKIKSEHVARVSDVGRLENGAPYMVMEYLDGLDLSAWLRSRGAMPVEQAIEFLLQACEAMAEAHSIGIVHRDLKPANLFCIQRADGLPAIKVLDFGISKATGLGASKGLGMTSTQAVMGSPLYMSPEQLASAKNVDARTDIWALGIILFELLSGRVPFEAETMPELVTKILHVPQTNIREMRPDVPAGVEQVLKRCLEKDRTKRYSNVAELAVALGEFGSPRARHSVERILRIAQTSGLARNVTGPASSGGVIAADAGTAPPWGRTNPAQRSSKAAKIGAIAAAIAVLLAAAIGGVLYTIHGRRAAVTPPTAPAPSASALASSSAAALPPASASAPSASALASSSAPPPVEPVASAADAPKLARPASAPRHAPSPVTPAPPSPAPPAPLAAKPPPSPSPAGTPSALPPPPAAQCNPPYYYDDRGNKVFKKECL